MNDIFFIADLHLGHSNILKYESRPFKDIYEQDKIFIENWNRIIKKQYFVYILGDVSFYPKEKTIEVLNRFNGRKVLIMGNHDRHKSPQYWMDVGFERVSPHPVCVEETFWLSHEPMFLDDNTIYKNIHGHVHSQGRNTQKSFCVSVEQINYTPILLKDIKKNMHSI
jgi:calcineurin-like phosphoesterase family protein